MIKLSKQVLLLAVLLLSSAPVLSAQPTDGLYRMMTGGPQPAAVVDLKFLPSVNQEAKVLATLLNPAGGYRVFLGTVERGGLNILYASIRTVDQPLPFLLAFDPGRPFRDYQSFLERETCQFFLFTGPAYYDFNCSDGSTILSSGRLERLPG